MTQVSFMKPTSNSRDSGTPVLERERGAAPRRYSVPIVHVRGHSPDMSTHRRILLTDDGRIAWKHGTVIEPAPLPSFRVSTSSLQGGCKNTDSSVSRKVGLYELECVFNFEILKLENKTF